MTTKKLTIKLLWFFFLDFVGFKMVKTFVLTSNASSTNERSKRKKMLKKWNKNEFHFFFSGSTNNEILSKYSYLCVSTEQSQSVYLSTVNYRLVFFSVFFATYKMKRRRQQQQQKSWLRIQINLTHFENVQK